MVDGVVICHAIGAHGARRVFRGNIGEAGRHGSRVGGSRSSLTNTCDPREGEYATKVIDNSEGRGRFKAHLPHSNFSANDSAKTEKAPDAAKPTVCGIIFRPYATVIPNVEAKSGGNLFCVTGIALLVCRPANFAPDSGDDSSSVTLAAPSFGEKLSTLGRKH
jgi:hypothetical protein